MSIGLIGKKLGMTQIFSENGSIIPITVIQAGPCFVVQKKTKAKEGYNSVQLGFEEVKEKRVNKPLLNHFKKAEVPPQARLHEFRVAGDEVDGYETGGQITIDMFTPGDFVDVTGVSIGKGYAGVVKRHGFKGAPAGHGSHEFFRHGGSIGANTTPAHTLKGMKMPGHLGAKKVTVQNLKVIEVRGDTNIVMVEGAVPGPRNGYIIIRKSVKKTNKQGTA